MESIPLHYVQRQCTATRRLQIDQIILLGYILFTLYFIDISFLLKITRNKEKQK